MNSLKYLLSLLLVLSIAGNTIAQLDIQVDVMPPYPVKLSDYTDIESNVFVKVTNNTNNTYEILLFGTLTHKERSDIRIETKTAGYIGSPIIIDPMAERQLIGADLSDLFNVNNLRISEGLTFDQINNNQALPPGNYELCLRAFNYNNRSEALSPQPDLFSGCAEIPNNYVEPPSFLFPSCDTDIPVTDGAIMFSWVQNPGIGSLSRIEYRIRMVEVIPQDRDPNAAFQVAVEPYLLDTGGIMATSFNLFVPEDVILEEGKKYAWQVISEDPERETQFENDGASEVCWFQYGDETAVEEFEFEPIYPKEGDYLPFDFTPFIVKFTPYSDDYRILEGELELSKKDGGSFTRIDTKSGRNLWPQGPKISQRSSGFSDITEEQSQHLPVYKNFSESPPTYPFERGKEMAWQFEGSIEEDDGTRYEDATGRITFNVGMSPPTPQSPANGSTQSPGNVQLRWMTADEPEKLVPPFDIAQWRGTGPINLYTAAVDERWVLEVSPSNEFDSIYYKATDRITLALNGVADAPSIASQLYKQISKDTTFTEPGIYYWRIKWLKDPENLSSEAYNVSPIWNFNIGTPTPTPTDTTTDERGPCLSGCEAPAITNRTAVTSLSTGTILKIGNFDLDVKRVTSSAGGRFSGEGEVNISFLNFKVLVAFENVQFNSENQIFSGTVKATEDREFPFTTTSNGGFQALGMDESTADGLDDYLNTGERLVSLFTGNRAIGLPIGIDKDVEGNQVTIAIVEMEFTPERAHLNAVVNLDLDIMGDTQFLSAGIGNFCFSPNGFGQEGIGFLPADHTFDLGDGGQASLKGLSSATSLADSSSYSYFSWDCNGFQCLNLVAEYEFPRDVIVPDTPDGTPGEGNVTARMNFKACRGFNFMGALNIEPFQIPTDAMEGYAFVVEEAWVDWSNIDNPPEFETNLPRNYVNADLRSSEPRLRNVWHGFWLKRLHLRIPEYVGNVDRERLSAGINNMIIDESGFTCSFRVENVVSWEEEGNVEGFAFSLDTIYVNIVQNSFTEAGLSGKLGLPIADERQFLLYKAAVAHDTSGTGFHFNVRPEERLDFPILIAQASIEPTTVIELRLGRENYIGVDINGSLSISSDNQPDESSGGNNALNLQMPGVRVQHLRLNSRDGFDDSDFTYSLTSPQKSMSGFPISLDELSLGLDGLNPSLTIQPRLTLAGESSGFSAAAKITINSEIYEKSNGKKSFRLTGVDLDAIHLDVTTSALSLSGYLEFYNEASAKGIRGALTAKLPMDISASLKAEFGTYRSSETARFNTAQYYSYWYVEGMVVFGSTGLNLFPSLNLYGLGGGVYHHMTQSGTPRVSQVMTSGSGAESAAPTSSGARYTPSFDSMLGLKFMALFGDPNQGKAYNFDVTLEAEFSTSAGLTHMGFTGQVRVITEGISSTENAPIMGFVDIHYYNPPGGDKTLEGSLGMTVDLYALRGTGTLTAVPAGYTGPTNNAFVMANFYVGPDKWYYHMGSPDNRAGLMIALPGSDDPLLEINSYMMIGHDIPATLPQPSEEFKRIFLGTNSEKFKANDGGRLSEIRDGAVARTDPGYANAKGFALGASFFTSMGANPVPFYFQIDMAMGFDINVTQSFERVCAETGETPGSDGWYAQGQFYAGIEGSFGIGITLFRERKFPIFEMGAGMLLRGGMPNPIWAEGKARIRYSVLGGLFEGQFNFTAQLGQKCSVLGEGPLANIEILQDLQPADQDGVSVFTSCTAAFAIPVDEILEIPREDDWEGTEPPLRVKPFVQSWTLKENNRISIPCDPIVYQEENTVAELSPTIVLKGITSYTQKIVLKAIEYFPDGRQTQLDWEESLEKSFKTGEAPDTLVEENILFTYPFKNQHFFLKEETQGSQGYVQLKRADPNIFDTYGRQEFKEHNYVVRFIELGTEASSEVPLQLIGDRSTIAFDVSDLKNDTHYAIQLLKIKIQQETRESGENRFAAQIENVPGIRNNAVSSTISVQNLDLIRSALGTITSDVIKKRTLPGPKVQNSFEHLIHHYYFKTDKVDRFEDKVKSVQLEKEHFRWGNIEGFTLKYPSGISFDWLDGKGYRNSAGRKIFDPLINVKIQQLGGEFATASDYPVNYYYQEKVMGNIEAPRVTLQAIVNRHLLPSLPYIRQMDYKRFVHFSSDSPFLSPLTERELNRANTPPPSMQSQMRYAVPSSSQQFGIGGLSIGNSVTLNNVVSSIEPATYKVTHTLSVPGLSNFTRFKSLASGYLSRRFPSVIVGSGMQTNSNSYVNQYRDKYGVRANGQRISSYFMTFHPGAYGTILRAIFKANDTMLYPATSRRERHSYISQYRYPLPGRTPRMANGSAWRHTFTHE